MKYKSSYSEAGVQVISDDEAGREDTPAHRVNLTADYLLGDHSVSYYGNFIGSQESWDVIEGSWDPDAGQTADDGTLYEIDSVMYHNLTYTYTLPWSNSFSLGVTNLTDEEPKFDYNGTYEGNLYDIRGRTYWAGFRQSF